MVTLAKKGIKCINEALSNYAENQNARPTRQNFNNQGPKYTNKNQVAHRGVPVLYPMRR